MKLAYSSKKVGGYLLAFFLLFGIITVASSSAQAQWQRDRDDRWERRRDRREDRYERRQGLQIARERGYSYGLNVGAADAQRRQSYNPQRSRYWRNGTEGYDDDFGNRGQYRQVFRNAFEQGYREGYQRYAYNNRRWDNRRYDNRWPRY
ncbi:MAG TPA: hypothetical protein VFR78_11220 [Pyrinomonadaceae bacterium]|nr:hypothetical protein [Pyrinomonadaceae bacterium]